MRTLLIGLLAATLIGCTSFVAPQAEMSSCSQTNGTLCLGSTAAPIELKPSPTTVHSAGKKVKSTLPKDISLSAKARPRSVTENAKSTSSVRGDNPPANQPAEAVDPIMNKAKTAIAAMMENPASAEFQDMKRAMRKNTFQQNVDTICGHVKGKNASGEDIGEIPFLYLVKDDEAYVVTRGPETAAASAYRNICS